MRNPFARKQSVSVPIDRISVVPDIGVHPYGYPEPTAFIEWEKQLVERLDALVAGGAADEGNADMLDAAIAHEAERARQALADEHTHHETFIAALIGRRDGDHAEIRRMREEIAERLPGLEERMLIARANHEAATHPNEAHNAEARRADRLERRGERRRSRPSFLSRLFPRGSGQTTAPNDLQIRNN